MSERESLCDDAPRTYGDYVRDWQKAREALAEARVLLAPDELGAVSFVALAVWFFKNGATVLDGLENLLDATAFKDSASLKRQTEIVQRLGAERG